MKNKNRALLSSVLSLILCISMLLGTTFAWFTDEVTSTGNIIKSGTLDATMEWKNPGDTEWKDASIGAIFNYEYWEPGYTELKFVKVENKGDLAFKFRLDVIPATPAAAGAVNLADVIDVYMVEVADPANLPTVDRAAIAGMTPVGTLSQLMKDNDGAAYGVMLPTSGSTTVDTSAIDPAITKTGTITYGIALKMQETAGNDYMNKTVGGQFSVRLLAAQMTYEGDSFGADYDTNAQYKGVIDFTASAAVTADPATGALTEAAAIGNDGEINAAVPAGVKLADGATELELSVKTLKESEANVTLENGESKQSLDIHVEGVAEDNTVPMTITLPGLLQKNLNEGNVKLYHVEDGTTYEMTRVAVPVNHNEFSYDSATGDVVVCLQSFSEVAVVADDLNQWKGTAADKFAGGNGTEENPYQIANASQLAYFRNLVDGGNDFDGQFVKLTEDIDLWNVNFDPIGWGYAYSGHNRDGAAGKVFSGTFDGGGHTISNLYQNGWDLESDTGTDYTYTNCGGGLFAAVYNGTIQNLTITGADIKMECVELGILVGLSQGNCAYTNINVYDSKIANYQRPAGGLIGEVSPDVNGEGTTTITNVEIGPDVVVGSLWGDFDAPVGGVIGARWDDGDQTTVVMTDVIVAAKLDVYNDVTAAYEWYAYRRAGMLIGNTDTPPADGKNSKVATAKFLTCNNVTVYYGDWVDYHYCQFTNQDSDWQSGYPWVRVEAGENCSALSNPRYGHPVVDGVAITDMNHSHADGDECNLELTFNQLYGGGQGVYGQPAHEGVETVNYKYTITYVNDGEVLDVVYVPTNAGEYETKNTEAQKIAEDWAKKHIAAGIVTFDGWMNAGSTKIEKVSADNTEDITLYPHFTSPHTASFVDQHGNVLAWCLFNDQDTSQLNATEERAFAKLPDLGDQYKFAYWEVRGTTSNGKKIKEKFSVKNYGADVTIYPYYTYTGAELIPVDSDNDGDTDYYQVGGYGNGQGSFVVDIPASVNGIPVTDIKANAFSSYPDLHAVVIPSTITQAGTNTVAKDWGALWGKGETITLYYKGSYADWLDTVKNFTDGWDDGLSESSQIFFMNGTGKVDPSQGYLQFDPTTNWIGQINGGDWQYIATISDSVKSHYTGTCDCDDCDGAIRPDAQYWS